ncbi:MAG: ADP-ribosylglycohydrolase family protein [Chloroflexota bacterium]
MLGAITGDIIGSIYENQNIKTTDFPLFSRHSRFTDDSVLTVAIADAVMHRTIHTYPILNYFNSRNMYATKIKTYGCRYPQAGYGASFKRWLASESLRGYGSYGNGSAMRVSPIGFAFDTLETTLREAYRSAVVTHNHREGIKGAQAIVGAVFLARTTQDKSAIRDFIQSHIGYDLTETIAQIRDYYTFDSSCQGSVPQAITAFLELENFEDAIRKAVSSGGDSDTIACMAGSIAHAYYGEIPAEIKNQVRFILDGQLKIIVDQFMTKYAIS